MQSFLISLIEFHNYADLSFFSAIVYGKNYDKESESTKQYLKQKFELFVECPLTLIKSLDTANIERLEAYLTAIDTIR